MLYQVHCATDSNGAQQTQLTYNEVHHDFRRYDVCNALLTVKSDRIGNSDTSDGASNADVNRYMKI